MKDARSYPTGRADFMKAAGSQADNETAVMPEQQRSSRRAGAAVFAAGALCVAIFWLAFPALQLNDGSDYRRFYEPVARNIVETGTITYTDGSPAVRYPPGYPLLLAGIFQLASLFALSEAAVESIFILLCAGSAALFLFMLARQAWPLLPALLAAAVWITYPFGLWLTRQPGTDVPFLPFFFAGLYLCASSVLNRKTGSLPFFFAGALIGVSSLIRPIAIGAILPMSLAVYLLRRELKPGLRLLLIAAMLLGNLAAILPWEGWVYMKTASLIPLSSGGAENMHDGLTFAVAKTCTAAEPDESGCYREAVRVPRDVSALMKEIDADFTTTETRSFTALISFLAAKARSEPAALAKLYALKAARSWYATDSGRLELPTMVIQIGYLFVIIAGSILALKGSGRARELAVIVWLMALYFWAMTVLGLSILRYMVPAMGVLMLLTPGMVPRWTHRYAGRSKEALS
jgi:hypothetical protein